VFKGGRRTLRKISPSYRNFLWRRWMGTDQSLCTCFVSLTIRTLRPFNREERLLLRSAGTGLALDHCHDIQVLGLWADPMPRCPTGAHAPSRTNLSNATRLFGTVCRHALLPPSPLRRPFALIITLVSNLHPYQCLVPHPPSTSAESPVLAATTRLWLHHSLALPCALHATGSCF
jgi:hypothetical protein